MKREDIPNMTSEQCSDELVMILIKRLLQKARRICEKADQALRDVYQALDDMCIDLDVNSDAENANTLEEAINCYVHYGEYNISKLKNKTVFGV